ncbi:alpha-ketoacid dehydrogenase subunit beta [Paenibacillus sp. chi10]|uniref:Alpha-ketoacid dehydrogenase subunit beta n=1 Tax=Paenibacillus suaedae TaxID=3077233 RepID=A0AAJ2K0E6_9BACL|nr:MULTISPECIES: alpha-ketoacid dehydrogenase subunit beta [unclassified Paenibacillus]MDT8977513.1 alpha-ketoacid dehydrogenase subunit beta [Paenibacillus sp. chi10]GAV14731.1 pyruvate dehydrogenase E1 component subunit beta [Paenibacillus sp. NAIST15-1]
MQRDLNLVQAINETLDLLLAEDDKVLLLGQDIGKNGGVFRVTENLFHKYGDQRVVDTPLSEAGIVGCGIGLALNGLKPIVEIEFLGFIYPALEQILSHLSRLRMRTQGKYEVPLIIRAPFGAGVRAPELHSESIESLFFQSPGLKVVIPSNPYDAKGLLIAAAEGNDPVIFLEPMKIYRSVRHPVPQHRYSVPLGKANVMKEGTDITVISWGSMVWNVVQAAELLEKSHGIRLEIVDLRTLYPFDIETIQESVRKTQRAVIVHEAPLTGGVGAELVAVIQERMFSNLKSPVKRITGFDVPIPQFSIEDYYLPSTDRIVHEIEQMLVSLER